MEPKASLGESWNTQVAPGLTLDDRGKTWVEGTEGALNDKDRGRSEGEGAGSEASGWGPPYLPSSPFFLSLLLFALLLLCFETGSC